ncbi:hypothetical protein [uncultured Vibrio sp.]|uniref:hypothetical protein n=1 Tax=uncultured Vibrio sp. TaxID=114054 RepID=UPI00260894D5|nr:hypothetical protein [uncultured Vibrio sp.]
MNTSFLSKLSLLTDALSKPLRIQLMSSLTSLYPYMDEKRKESFLNVYAAFLFSQSKTNFNTIEILNNSEKFQEHVDILIGFIYGESKNLTVSSLGRIAKPLHSMMCELAKTNDIEITAQTFNEKRVNDYTQSCLKKYQSLPVDFDEERLAYLDGWTITAQDRKKIPAQLDFLYVKYGRDLTRKIHRTLNQFGLTQKTTTLKSRTQEIVRLLKTVSTLDKQGTVESFEMLLNARNSQFTFYKAYQIQLSECLAKNNELVVFNHSFIRALDVYESAFINKKVYPAPLKPFIKPSILEVKNPPSFSIGGEPGEVEKARWFADIPLYIKDEQAIEIIESRINHGMSYLKAVLINHFNMLKKRHERNKTFIKNGWIKPLRGNLVSSPQGVIGNMACKIGEDHIANTVATFYHYGINGYSGIEYSTFLGFMGKNNELLKELNLPTNSTLFTLTALLVIEHPKITPAWLQKLQLFNEHGKKLGYFQAGEQFILSSDKERRGRNLAQQDVVLNDFSKSIVDFIVEHTELARQHLKSIGNPDWKYLLLTSNLNRANKPSLGSSLYKRMPFITDLLNDEACIPTDHNLSQQDINSISSIATHRAIRRHRGLQIYLKTRSQSAVAEALGHKEVQHQLLEVYLPKPLMDFFTERVVRQFQKAIILKAMEESPHLLDAVNMSYEEIIEFMENHGLNGIPDFNADFDKAASKVGQGIFESVIFTITMPLIQMLISIKTIIDTDDNESNYNDLVQHWYQSAIYLLKRFELGDFSDSDEIEEMYQEAKENPLNHDVIKGLISC